jgi:hypothetical protein
VKGRQGRRCKQLLDDLKEKRGPWKFKEGVLDHSFWRTHFGRGHGPVIRQTMEFGSHHPTVLISSVFIPFPE